ncbi:MAG: hypothetical protein H8E31_00475 [Planctomycetes bacterium]|nr:hypothetical protein [Planctomycetota bacterium]
MRPLLAALLLAALCPSCANAYRSTVHEHSAVGLRWLAAEGLQSDRQDPRRADQRLQGLDASGYAVTFEEWIDAGSSVLFELGRRSYPTAAVDARALELRTVGREYFLEDSRTQPFLEGALVLSAIDVDTVDGLVLGVGAAGGGGLRHFFSNAFSLDLSATYTAMVVDPRTVTTAKGDRFRTEEELYGWEFAVQLAFLF